MLRPEPVQIREYLALAKRQRIPFDQAWDWAFGRVRWDHNTPRRRQAKETIQQMRWAVELAYRNEPVPGGPLLLRLLERLQEEDHEPRDVRSPPVIIAPRERKSEAA